MRRINFLYIYQQPKWPHFQWDMTVIAPALAEVRYKQGKLKAYMELLGFDVRSETTLQTLTQDVLKSTEIEGEFLNPEQVRSSIATRLGIDAGGIITADRNVEGVVEMMLDATQNYLSSLTTDRLFAWHSSLFPAGRSGIHKITVGNWRTAEAGPMQVVSGAMGKEKIHFEAPDASLVEKEMKIFIEWFNTENKLDDVIKSAIAHLWFVTIHPFDDGNGRMARTIADMLLTRSDDYAQRFYSMSAQIRLQRKEYYDILEHTQKGSLDITTWINWYLNCLNSALDVTDTTMQKVVHKARFWDTHHQTSINERQRLMINKLFDGFTGKLSTSKWAKICKCSADTALRDIQDLVEKNMFQKESAGGRSTSYILKL